MLSPLFALASLVIASSTSADSRVCPSALLIPLGAKSAVPVTPDRVRAESPWTLSLFGDWRFKLTHGEIVDGRFVMSRSEQLGVSASSAQPGNSEAHAFDGNMETRWCANGSAFPQWLQARLDQPHVISGVDIAWERPGAHYKCRVEGGDGVHWRTLIDRSAGAGIGDGLLAAKADETAVRYVRLVILGADEGSWASVRELKIHYSVGGADVIWRPAEPQMVAPAHSDDFVAPGFADDQWGHLTVPSNWEMAGYSVPTYNSVDDTVGLYRRWIQVPASWSGRKIFWRCDGALDGAEVFVNGQRAGYHESGYTSFDVDLTGLIRPGERNLIAVRVCKTTPSVDAETGDYQCMGGIFRDTRLIAVPRTYVEDLTVRTPLTDGYRDAALSAAVRVSGTPGETVGVGGYVADASGRRVVDLPGEDVVVGAEGRASVKLSKLVSGPKLWSAESPALYYLVLELRRGAEAVERVEQRFGFRQVEIKNQVVLWNGKPIKCFGICRHDFWPDKGFALTDAEWKKDLTLMKETNINAIRTSHYNHAARFLELCDERGFYVLDEVPFCWVDDRVKDPAFAPALLERAAETLARDKNRACVLAWSLGNENPVGIDTQMVHDLVAKEDPTRPSFASGAGPDSVKGQELFDTHYPSPEGLRHYIEKSSHVAPLVITEHPHTFFSRETQTYDPGASDTWSEGLLATWDLLWRSPTILGSFIWEWQSQGIADKFPDHSTDFYYGLDHMRQENNKGIMSAFRKPKPEQWIVKMVYSPVQFPSRSLRISGGVCVVPVENRYAFTDLNQLRVKWTAWNDGVLLGHGVARVDCPAGQSTDARIAVPAGVTALELVVDRADGSNVTVARLGDSHPTAPTGYAEAGALSVRGLEVGNALQTVRFDQKTGAIARWVVDGRDRLRGSGPFLNLGGSSDAKGDHYYRSKALPVLDEAVVSFERGGDGVVSVVSCSKVYRPGASRELLGTLTARYAIRPDAEIAVHYRLDWAAADTRLWEIGLGFPVPSSDDRCSWSRESYFSAYPKGHIGAPVGACDSRDVAFRSSKRSLKFLTLTDGAGVGLAVLPLSTPLVGRCGAGVLYASREVAAAGPDDLSWSWFHDHDIQASGRKALEGDFMLRAVAP